MISSEQIKAARALLGWSAVELSKASGVGLTTIRRYELSSGVPQANISRLILLRHALEQAGIEFTGDPNTNPGVTLHLNKS
jgi:transcriptional regulator with XRE-family HTH domain